MQAYSNSEVFYASKQVCDEWNNIDGRPADDPNTYKPGWYFWYCFPGCLPDSDPYGPYETAQEAEHASQDDMDW